MKTQDWTEVEMTRNEIATEASIYFMSCRAGIDLQKSSELKARGSSLAVGCSLKGIT